MRSSILGAPGPPRGKFGASSSRGRLLGALGEALVDRLADRLAEGYIACDFLASADATSLPIICNFLQIICDILAKHLQGPSAARGASLGGVPMGS